MPIKKENSIKIQAIWNTFLDSQKDSLKDNLSELQISALYTCIEDCYESFYKIYFELIPLLDIAYKSENYDEMQTIVIDMYWAFDHIKNHVKDSDKGFSELSRQLEIIEKNLNIKKNNINKI